MTATHSATPPTGVLAVPRGRIDALQGLRGAAVLMVVVSHCFPDDARTSTLGAMGVTMFFTLSGFLITGVLLDLRGSGARGVIGFFAARFVRLAPALLLLITITGVLWTVSGRSKAEYVQYALTAGLYVENIFSAAHAHQILAHTWSLAVEEQFYMVWPFVLLLILRGRPRTRVIAVLLLAALSAVARFELYHTPLIAAAYSGIGTNAYALLLGCGLRLLPFRLRIWSGTAWIGLGLIAFLGAFGTKLPEGYALSPILTACATTLVIAGSLHGNALLGARPLVFLGTVSYAWYLWHWVALWFTGTLHSPPFSIAVSATALWIACGSTFYLEDPLRRAFHSSLRQGTGWWPTRLLHTTSAVEASSRRKLPRQRIVT